MYEIGFSWHHFLKIRMGDMDSAVLDVPNVYDITYSMIDRIAAYFNYIL